MLEILASSGGRVGVKFRSVTRPRQPCPPVLNARLVCVCGTPGGGQKAVARRSLLAGSIHDTGSERIFFPSCTTETSTTLARSYCFSSSCCCCCYRMLSLTRCPPCLETLKAAAAGLLVHGELQARYLNYSTHPFCACREGTKTTRERLTSKPYRATNTDPRKATDPEMFGTACLCRRPKKMDRPAPSPLSTEHSQGLDCSLPRGRTNRRRAPSAENIPCEVEAPLLRFIVPSSGPAPPAAAAVADAMALQRG